MEKYKNVLVVASCPASISELTGGASALAERVTLVYAGERSWGKNADKAYYLGALGEAASFVTYIPTILDLVSRLAPEAVLLDCSRDGRLAAAGIAACLGTAAQVDASELTLSEGRVITKRMVFGGAALDTEKSGATAVVCVSPGVFMPAASDKILEIEDVPTKLDGRIRFIAKHPKEVSSTNLAAAKKVVGVGRGLADESDLAMCREFASMLGAEVGCTRPVAEEKQWLPKESYIGVSGAMIKPELYFAIGVSGQIQHVVGVNKAGTIIAVDKNEAAPVFKYCDYGIVGDLHKVIPGIMALLE